jgi:uncharacterized delta-60 repeat protein
MPLRLLKLGFLLAALLFTLVPLADASSRAGPGSLDPSFGPAGFVTTAIGSVSGAQAVAVQRDGKIVAAGDGASVTATYGGFALARYRPNGFLDRGFGIAGTATTAISSVDSSAYALALQPDGKIVAAGYAVFAADDNVFALARYNPDGSLDPSFGTGGVATTAIGLWSRGYALALQPDGKIVVAGHAATGYARGGFALARYHPDGSLDPSFGEGGTVITKFRATDYGEVRALALQPDGKIVVAGTVFSARSDGGIGAALARYNQDGSLDPSFGTGGQIWTDFEARTRYAYALALQRDGKIVVAGLDERFSFVLARLQPDGSLDPSFGEFGTVMTGPSAQLFALALQPDGKILAAGYVEEDRPPRMVLARYRPNGGPDQYFGTHGWVVGPRGSTASALALQPNGKIVAAGTNYWEAETFFIARYIGGSLHCVVPKLTGKRLAQARREIRHAHCSLGRVRRKWSSRIDKGRVIGQRPRAHVKRPAGSKVRLVVSKGKR